MSILKNFILLADMHHSVQLLMWREEDTSLTFISKDYEPSVALATGYLYDGPKLGMLMADDEGNLQLFQENPRFVMGDILHPCCIFEGCFLSLSPRNALTKINMRYI